MISINAGAISLGSHWQYHSLSSRARSKSAANFYRENRKRRRAQRSLTKPETLGTVGATTEFQLSRRQVRLELKEDRHV
jgi:hypothetical protein